MNREKHNVCINVPKVFDWVVRPIELPVISISGTEELEELFPNCPPPTPSPAEDFCSFVVSNNLRAECRVLEDTIITREVGYSEERDKRRRRVDVTLPSGECIKLQRVKVLVKGQLVVDAVNENNMVICTSQPIEFSTIQTFYLCAPKDTEVETLVTQGECDAEFVCELGPTPHAQLDISISFCLDVAVIDFVKLEVEAAYCKPRDEFSLSQTICKTDLFPPQCPQVFPGSKPPVKKNDVVDTRQINELKEDIRISERNLTLSPDFLLLYSFLFTYI